MIFLATPLSQLPTEEVSVATLPEEIQNWIKSVYRDCSPFFELPERVSFRMVRSVLKWKAIDAERRPLEAKWGERLADDFERWGRAVGRVYTRTERIGDALDVADDLIRIQFRNELALLWVEVGKKFYRSTEADILGKAISDNFTELDTLDDAEFQAYVSRAVAQKVTAVAGSTKRAIAETIERGLRDGDSIRDIVGKLQSGLAFGRHRGFLIARTEVIGASNGATHFANGKHYDRATTEKEWLATRDGRVRASHSAANGQRVGFSETFSVGHAQLMFPADTESGAGHPEEVINCRCTLLYHTTGTGTTSPTGRAPRRRRVPGAPGSPSQVAVEEITAASVRRQVIDALEDVGKEIEALKDIHRGLINRTNKALANYKRVRTPENLEVYNALFQEATDIGKRLPKMYKKSADEFLKIWNPSGKKRTKIEYVKDQFGKGRFKQANFDESKRFMEGLGGLPDQKELKIQWRKVDARDRHRASQYDGDAHIKQPDGSYKREHRSTIKLDTHHTAETYIHETGHAFDANSKEFSDKVEAHYKKRTKGEPLEKLSDLTGNPNYKDTEVARRDQWITAYEGKDYTAMGIRNKSGNYASEVTSMTVQQLYENPARLALQDEDTFDFFWNLFVGP